MKTWLFGSHSSVTEPSKLPGELVVALVPLGEIVSLFVRIPGRVTRRRGRASVSAGKTGRGMAGIRQAIVPLSSKPRTVGEGASQGAHPHADCCDGARRNHPCWCIAALKGTLLVQALPALLPLLCCGAENTTGVLKLDRCTRVLWATMHPSSFLE
jgi:hypothetical protein